MTRYSHVFWGQRLPSKELLVQILNQKVLMMVKLLTATISNAPVHVTACTLHINLDDL